MADCRDCSHCEVGSGPSASTKVAWICTRGGRSRRLSEDYQICNHFTTGEVHHCYECKYGDPNQGMFATRDKDYFCRKKHRRINGDDDACRDFEEGYEED